MTTQFPSGRSPEPAAVEQWLYESYLAMHKCSVASGDFRTFEADFEVAFAHLLSVYEGNVEKTRALYDKKIAVYRSLLDGMHPEDSARTSLEATLVAAQSARPS